MSRAFTIKSLLRLWVALSVTLSGSLPARAEVSEPLSGRWDDARTDALARLDDASRLLTTGSIVDGVSAVAGLAGVSADAPPSVPAALGIRLPASTAISALLGAVQRAEALARSAVRMDRADLLAARQRVDDVMREWTADPSRPPRSQLADVRESVARGVDTAKLVEASAILARAIEEALPQLRAVASTLETPSRGATGCDYEVANVLCLGLTGANTYDKDFALLIDLGGDDIHANSAGGADPLSNGLPVSVTIDVGGNDLYRSTLATADVAQGAGFTGGVGVLVDAAGNDTYEIEATAANADANGQGYGESGAGLLADLGGNDRYSLRNLGAGTQNANGQGYAGAGGVALSLDAGGDDTYSVESRPTPVVFETGLVSLGTAGGYGFGYGILGGVAAFASGSGTDSMEVATILGPLPEGEDGPVFSASSTILAFGDGAAGGVGVAVAGSGNTSWVARSELHSPGAGTDFAGSAFIGGTGEGALGGYGGIYDAAGNDTYRSEALAHAVQSRSIDDSCGCSSVGALAMAGGASILGTGYGAAGGVGIVHDVTGDDHYVARAISIAEATSHDGREELPASPPGETPPVAARAEARTPDPNVFVQGAGIIGAGFVVDAAGADIYEVRAIAEARATATAADPDARTEGIALSGAASTLAQGVAQLGGYGDLRDTGGADSYIAESRSTAVAEPATTIAKGLVSSSVQGSVELGGASHLADIDGGAADSFVATPADPACLGTRGQGVWGDCGLGLGVGVNA